MTKLTADEYIEVAKIVNRIGANHGFALDNAEYFIVNGHPWFEVAIEPLPNSHLSKSHCVGVMAYGRPVQALAAEAAGALAIWADHRTRQ